MTSFRTALRRSFRGENLPAAEPENAFGYAVNVYVNVVNHSNSLSAPKTFVTDLYLPKNGCKPRFLCGIL